MPEAERGTLALSAATASLLGVLVAGGRDGLALALAGAVRNVSFPWAASVEVLPLRADVVFVVALAATFAMPGALRAATFIAARVQFGWAGGARVPVATSPSPGAPTTPPSAAQDSDSDTPPRASLAMVHARELVLGGARRGGGGRHGTVW